MQNSHMAVHICIQRVNCIQKVSENGDECSAVLSAYNCAKATNQQH